ncbi:ribonuclease M5 [Planifilum fulgidum]|jgi:ribonuclease M5|uniref:Ribonuclease M5 n=1 Tax=Planifilum fulgidum TaxID=201973 RepID=A0A1I2PWC3_9BACL|nr:ribonuclease M5 [Planifilum fulgidum]SFG19409.1 ribonuclease M5 [Planifilum fulgidum]
MRHVVKKIKEVIVVEGKKDTAAVQRAVAADTLETGGSAVGSDLISAIRRARDKRGVIILTDPDGPGERIRRIISEQVSGCKHAFIPREEATGRDGVGVEHASPEAIRRALERVRTEEEPEGETITWEEYLQAGLVGGEQARRRREAVGKAMGIGYGNGRRFFRKLQLFRITREELARALDRIEGKNEG